MNVLTVVGARPQFIKASPVSQALRQIGLSERLVHTGQHYDTEMSQVFFEELGMEPPATNLEVGSGSHAEQTGKMLIGLERELLEHRARAVIVYGDTNSTVAGALAAAKLEIPIAHVEAGLRSFNRRMPEEINRIVTDAIADLLFAPTQRALDNLLREGVSAEKVRLVGDVMLDAVLQHAADSKRSETLLESLGVKPRRFVLATIHRAGNTDDAATLSILLDSLARVAATIPVVLPLHPRTRARLSSDRIASIEGKVTITGPQSYLSMLALERNAALVVTDSGGVQKEAFFFGVPCVTLREETEWVELVELGWNRLCPPSSVEQVSECILGSIGSRGVEATPYGKGDAALHIASDLKAFLS
jgi:UDP-GlcNAc3NAcA epimerase